MAKELNKFILSAIAIIGLTIIVLIGMAVSSNFSKVLRKDTTINASDVEFVASLSAPNISNSAPSVYPFLQSLTLCGNDTNLNTSNLLPVASYVISEGGASGGEITLNQNGLAWEGESINCSNVNYLADSDGQIVADKFTTGLGIFGTFAVILVLAIVGKAIIGLFKKKD